MKSNLIFTCLVVRYLYIKCLERSDSSIGPRVRSWEFVDYFHRGIEVYSPRPLSSRSLTRLGSWRRGSASAKVAKSILNRIRSWGHLRFMRIMGLRNILHDYCQVGPQPTWHRGVASVSCGSWSWDIFSMIIAKSVLNRLDIVGSWNFLHGHCKLPSRSLTDVRLPSWSSVRCQVGL